ncbi:MAG: serine/threonine protein kinase [Sandaracinus sp.]|nr:serine/threonine protein kinase [Sandaracinus sp.]
MDSEEVALRETMMAQGLDETHAVGATLRGETNPRRSVPSVLPPARIARDSEDPADFRIKGELGRGGMGVVCLAEQAVPSREVALKRLTRVDAPLVDALLREATITGRLEHPNIVPVHAVVADADGPAVVMKRIAGEDWSTLARSGVSLERHLEIFVQVCNAVAFAHSRGVIHRDIKLDNVRIGDFGAVYLLDWGVARRLDEESSGRIVGTPVHMAPEMTRGIADARSDVFLLGAALHEAITGRPRHEGETLVEVLQRAREATAHVHDARVPRELAAIVERACAKDPDARFESVSALQDAVLRFREHRSAAKLAASGSERLVELERLASGEGEYSAAQRAFTEARFAFEQARVAWPEGELAVRGSQRALELMARIELAHGQPDGADACLDAMDDAPDALRAQSRALRERQRHERERLAKLEHDQDRGVGEAMRNRATIGLAVAVVLLTAGLVGLRTWRPDYATPQLRFALGGTLVFGAVFAVTRWWRRRGEWNLVNRRIAQIALLTLGVSALQRYASLVGGTEPSRILLTDAFLVGMGGVALTPFHRGGPWLAAMAFALAFVGALRPTWIEPGFIGFAIFVPVFFGAWRRWGPKARPDSD